MCTPEEKLILPEISHILQLTKENGFSDSGFAVLENTLFLVCALPYGNDMPLPPPCQKNGFGRIAPFAQFNYYKEAVKRLKKIRSVLQKNYGGAKDDYRIFCNSRIPEKPLAAAAGIGFIGKHSLVITKEAGTLAVIAAMTMKTPAAEQRFVKPIDTDKNTLHSFAGFPFCNSCDKKNPPCRIACPSGAIKNDGAIEITKCIQWYASGNSGFVPDSIVNVWGDVFYGCTKCQDSCPHNKKNITGIKTNLGKLDMFIDAKNILAMPDKEIKQYFKGSTLGTSWLTPKALRRNAQCILHC
ncbi:MAG: hypothetical protein Ta2F_04940 [Termitinemataceae bacterium]|nr:MAG: hypothetical protein Ta2F_04940 [Termitinemataceae bacterium]